MSYPVRKTWKTLHLTSPLMHGVDGEVKEAQELLTHNRFKDFQPGKIDGTYGEHTAGATHRAKYWMGYKKSSITGQFGTFTRRHLLPTTHSQYLPLERANRIRRAARLAAYKLAQRKRNTISEERK